MTDEIFGPILPIRGVADADEAVAFVNERDRPLALYVFADNDVVARDVVERTASGTAAINAAMYQAAVPDLPFGGIGASGFGAYHGRRSFETFSHAKGVVRKSPRPDPALAYPPYTKWKFWLLRRFL